MSLKEIPDIPRWQQWPGKLSSGKLAAAGGHMVSVLQKLGADNLQTKAVL